MSELLSAEERELRTAIAMFLAGHHAAHENRCFKEVCDYDELDTHCRLCRAWASYRDLTAASTPASEDTRPLPDEVEDALRTVRRSVARVYGRSKDSGRSLKPEADLLHATITTLHSTIESLEAEKALYERALELACEEKARPRYTPAFRIDDAIAWRDYYLTQAREEGK